MSYCEIPATAPEHNFCVGTLISKRHILTAKHCFLDAVTGRPLRNFADIIASIGANDSTRGRKYWINSFKTYEDWAWENKKRPRKRYHDIAIVTLGEDVNNVKPATISRSNHRKIYGKKVITAGWGATIHESDPRFLQKAPIYVISKNDCKNNFKNTGASSIMHKNHLCTVNRPPVSFGPGDSGGPLLLDKKVVGVNSHVSANDMYHPNEQNVHQSVYYYRSFIKSFVKKTSFPRNDGARTSRKSWWKPWLSLC